MHRFNNANTIILFELIFHDIHSRVQQKIWKGERVERVSLNLILNPRNESPNNRPLNDFLLPLPIRLKTLILISEKSPLICSRPRKRLNMAFGATFGSTFFHPNAEKKKKKIRSFETTELLQTNYLRTLYRSSRISRGETRYFNDVSIDLIDRLTHWQLHFVL